MVSGESLHRITTLINLAKRRDLKAEDDAELRTYVRNLTPQELALYLHLYGYKAPEDYHRYSSKTGTVFLTLLGWVVMVTFMIGGVKVATRLDTVRIDEKLYLSLVSYLYLGVGIIYFVAKLGWMNREKQMFRSLFGEQLSRKDADPSSLRRVVTVLGDAQFLPVILDFGIQKGCRWKKEYKSAITRCLNDVTSPGKATLEDSHCDFLADFLEPPMYDDDVDLFVSIIRASPFISHKLLTYQISCIAKSDRILNMDPMVAGRMREEAQKVLPATDKLPLTSGG